MDELVVCPASTACSSVPSPASFFSLAGNHHHQELDFVSSEVLEQWLATDDDCMDDETVMDGAAWGDEGRRSPAGNNNELSGKPPAPAPKRRGRKPGPRSSGLALNHVEAERQRRDKPNRRFCELRAAVPTVSRMDKASLLADAVVAYITQLRGRVEQLEAEAKQAAVAAAATAAAPAHSSAAQEKLEVRMVVGQEAAALRLTTAAAARHAPRASCWRSGRWTCPCSTRACAAWAASLCRTPSSTYPPPSCGTSATSAPRCSTNCSSG